MRPETQDALIFRDPVRSFLQACDYRTGDPDIRKVLFLLHRCTGNDGAEDTVDEWGVGDVFEESVIGGRSVRISGVCDCRAEDGV